MSPYCTQVDTACWRTVKSVASWLKDNGMTTETAYAYFVNRVQVCIYAYRLVDPGPAT